MRRTGQKAQELKMRRASAGRPSGKNFPENEAELMDVRTEFAFTEEMRFFQSKSREWLKDRSFRGKYVAIRKKKVVDVDPDNLKLARRVNQKYPRQAVLIAKVEPQKRIIELPSPEVLR